MKTRMGGPQAEGILTAEATSCTLALYTLSFGVGNFAGGFSRYMVPHLGGAEREWGGDVEIAHHVHTS